MFMSDSNVHFLAHGDNVLVPNPSKRFRILLECEVGGAPVFEQSGQNIRGLTSDHEQTRT